MVTSSASSASSASSQRGRTRHQGQRVTLSSASAQPVREAASQPKRTTASRKQRGSQLELQLRRRGGAPGAGRPPNGEKAGVSHWRRPSLSRHHPVHVTLRVRQGVSSLREHALFGAVRRALAAGKARFGFGLVHFSVQRDHLHLIAEAHDRRALSRGVQGLSIRVARAVNRQLERAGKVFADRYHARALRSPREVRFALRYVLLNARKHARQAVPAGFVDQRSSAPWFEGFSRPLELAFGAREARSEWLHASGSRDPPVVAPGTWLLRRGVREFDVDEVPGE
jgi:putative transposase